MISYLKSKFDLFGKRAVFVTGEAVLVFHWRRGSVSESFAFDMDDSGMANFDRYLREWPLLPTYILVDLVEEEYRQETIPHVYGSDRQALIARKQAWLFRGTPYCSAAMQGREEGGRRDDRVLYSAILNPQVLAPWVQLCTKNKVPLVGIFSLPILSQALLPKLGIEAGNALLVTMQSTSGLRQSFFAEGALKLSRLAKMPRLGSVPFAPYLLGELEKTQRYLSSLRLTTAQRLNVFIFTHGDLLDDLEAECRDSDSVRYRLIDVGDAARRLGVHGVLTTPFSDYLFAHMLLVNPPRNHYATPAERVYFNLHRMRQTLWGLSVGVLFGGTLIGAYNLVRGVALKQDAQERLNMAQFYETRLRQAREGLPAVAVEPPAIKNAVDIVEGLKSRMADPFTAYLEISDALNDFPTLRIEEIVWNTDAASFFQAGEKPRSGASGPAAIVKGRIDPYSGDVRGAINSVNGFAETLRGGQTVRDVTILTMPLDLSSKATMEGGTAAGSSASNVSFSVRIILGSVNETG